MATGYYNVSENSANIVVAATITSPVGNTTIDLNGAYELMLGIAASKKAPLYATTLRTTEYISLMGPLSVKKLERSVTAIGIFSNNESSIWMVSITAMEDDPNKLFVYKVAL